MRENLKSNLPDKDMQGAPAALLRAARYARELARKTQTEYVTFENGELIRQIPPLHMPPRRQEI
jgi:hypothetical protein